MRATEGDCEWCGLWYRVRYYIRLLDGRGAWVCSSCERSIAKHRAWQANDERRRVASRG